MTKKIFLGMSAMAMLFATSCKDDFAESFVGDQATVEFSISTPEIGTRAYSDGMTATKLQYAVYDAAGNQLTALGGQKEIKGSTTVSLELTTGESYQVIFWADAYGNAENAPYTVDFANKKMTVNYTNAVSNDENRDAFYKYETFTVNGAESKTIELRRPFAQLNIGTSDYAAATATNYNPTQSKVTVKNIYNTLNLATGAVSGEEEVVFGYANINRGETFPVVGYEYLAMNYLLVPADQEVVDIEFGYKGTNDAEHTRQVGSVPVQRNYRTNIYGKLLTSTVDVNVEIKPEYNEPDYNNKYEVSTASQLQEAIYDAVAAGNGIITLTDNITANLIITIGGTNTRSNADAQNAQIVIEGNGKTLTSTAARAINVETEGNVVFNNLTINAAERAINIINKPANVTINNVTATANNNAVMMATSATGAKLTINESDLTGLATVNVASANSEVEINNTNITNVDASNAESYGAISVFKTATNSTVVVNGGKIVVAGDSVAASIGAEDATVTFNGTEGADKVHTIVAYIGNAGFTTLKEAIAYAKDGNTITLIRDIVFDENTRTHNSGTYYDGLYYIGDKSFTIDLNGKTISQDGSVNDYLLNFKNEGTKANTITIKKGIIDAGTAAFCALCTSSVQENQLTINLENVTLINDIDNGSTVRVRGGAILNVKEGTKIIGKDSYLGIENYASTVNIYDGAEIYMEGTSSYNGCLAGVAYAGTINVYGGYGKGVKGGFIAMTSGGTINVSGGEWIANTDGTIGDNSNLYVLTAQSNKYESGFAGPSVINVTGGTFRGGMDAWVLNNLPGEQAELNISGGNFNANPTRYLEDGKTANEANGIWTVK